MKDRNTTFTATLVVVACFAFLPKSRAVNPPPDGGYAGGNTAEGQNALLSLTSGTFNTALGSFALNSTSTGKFNTGTGADTLFANTGDQNTATGAGALLSNTTGSLNTANGAFALFSNTAGSGNNAVGNAALFSNTTGGQNTAIGDITLHGNTTAAATPPTVLARSILTLLAVPIQRLVRTHSLATLPPAKTQASAPSRSKATQLAVLRVEAE